MTLTLTIRNAGGIEDGRPTQLTLDERAGTIGRSSACDWSLPDPDKQISSKHAEISYSGGDYVLNDVSTNGTFLNGASERMGSPRRIENGDVFRIGKFEIAASIDAAVTATPFQQAKTETPALVAEKPAAAPAPAEVGREPELVGAGASLANDAPPPAAPAPTPPRAPDRPRPAAAEAEAGEEDLVEYSEEGWNAIAEGNEVDWKRGGFSKEELKPLPTVGGAAGANADQLVASFLEAAGLEANAVKSESPEIIARAGRLMKRLVAGLVVMVEARARAKSQMGAEATSLQFEGNNPIKFTRTPEQALVRLLSPAERGFMDSERAIEDAFYDLQLHQVATLKAMQGALRSSLQRFSPGAIRRRAEVKGFMSRLFPAARDAGLWQAYEKEFGSVAQESDEVFLEVFAKYFRKAYEEQARKQAE